MKKVIIPIINSNTEERDHVLLYNEPKKAYYAVSRAELLSAQDHEIAKLRAEMELLKTQNELFKQQISALFEGLKKDYQENFLVTYQETNNELIKMVQSLIEKK